MLRRVHILKRLIPNLAFINLFLFLYFISNENVSICLITFKLPTLIKIAFNGIFHEIESSKFTIKQIVSIICYKIE